MTYEQIAEEWISLAQRNSSGLDNCTDILKGEGRLLCLLLDTNKSMLAGEIGQATNITTGRVANLLKQLESKELITRNHCPNDKRQTVVALTEKGHQRALEIKHANINREVDVLKTLGKENAETLVKLFEAYLDAKATIRSQQCI